jgi:hypothetical protein
MRNRMSRGRSSAMIVFRGLSFFVAVHVSGASNFTHTNSMDTYCPTARDFGSDGNVQWHGNGWTIYGGGGVHSKTTWNLNGGYIEFDMDTSGANAAVNTNLYTTSPERGQLSGSNDCDIQGQGKPSCMEMDIVEMNGNCAAQTTVHTWPNFNGDCDRGGCWSGIRIGGKFHVKAEFSPGGWMTVSFNGQKNEHYQPSPSKDSQNYAAQTMQRLGAQIQSSQWVGWVPDGNSCPAGGDLGSSHFSIENLVVRGSVVQGQQPSRCASPPTMSFMNNVTFV